MSAMSRKRTKTISIWDGCNGGLPPQKRSLRVKVSLPETRRSIGQNIKTNRLVYRTNITLRSEQLNYHHECMKHPTLASDGSIDQKLKTFPQLVWIAEMYLRENNANQLFLRVNEEQGSEPPVPAK